MRGDKVGTGELAARRDIEPALKPVPLLSKKNDRLLRSRCFGWQVNPMRLAVHTSRVWTLCVCVCVCARARVYTCRVWSRRQRVRTHARSHTNTHVRAAYTRVYTAGSEAELPASYACC